MLKISTPLIYSLTLMFASYFASQHSIAAQSNTSIEEVNKLEGQLVQFITNKGNFTIELYAKKSPQSVLNFVEYVKSGFYKQTIFHRAIRGVILQGGGYTSDLIAKKTRAPIANESKNNIANTTGTIAMARMKTAHSATSQFFINLRDNPSLDAKGNEYGYTVFGKVVNGLPLLKTLAKTKTKKQDLHQYIPVDEIKIIDVQLIEKIGLKEIKPNKVNISENKNNEKFVEGIHYVRLKEPIKLSDNKINTNSNVEVISAFSFGCGHCYGIYPLTQQWSHSHKSDTTFSYFHAVWNQAMRVYARSYYAAIELKIENKIHLPMFEAVVINQQKLDNQDDFAGFFESFGVEKDKFIKIFNSEPVSQRVEQAEKLTKLFNLASVPEFIVAGKYRVEPMRAGGQDEVFDVIDFLVKREKMQQSPK